MLWFCLLSSLAGGIFVCCWMNCQSRMHCRQAQQSQTASESSEHTLLISQTASECCSMLAALEDHKEQLRHRLTMLDEMIEKSDREIDRLYEQLGRMAHICNRPLDDTGRDMLSLLRAGGYDEQEIQHLTLRNFDELEDAA